MLALQAAEQVHDLRSHAHIESRDRLIQNQQLGPKGQRAGNVDALALTAGELVRMTRKRRLVHAHFG